MTPAIPSPPATPGLIPRCLRVSAFAQLVNGHRLSQGCLALEWSSAIAAVAQSHSQDMVERGFFSHTNPDGDSPGDRLNAVGINGSGWAENIASGYLDAASALEGWLGSPGHRANIENCSLTHHGAGLVSARWTHLFLRQ